MIEPREAAFDVDIDTSSAFDSDLTVSMVLVICGNVYAGLWFDGFGIKCKAERNGNNFETFNQRKCPWNAQLDLENQKSCHIANSLRDMRFCYNTKLPDPFLSFSQSLCPA